MDVITFLTKYSKDLEFKNLDYDQHLKRLEEFHNRTSQYHILVKKSYFSTSKSYIKLCDFKGIGRLANFHNAYLFTESDEMNLLELIQLTSETLQSLSKDNLSWALNYLYYMLDYMFHEQLYSTTKNDLLECFEKLKIKVVANKHLDFEGNGQLVLDKIGLISSM